MLGTAPVIVLYLMYVVVSGAVQLKIGGCEAATTVSTILAEDDTSKNYWQLLNAVMLALSAVSMGVTMFMFAYFMDKALISRKDEIDAVPIDVEVEEYEKTQEELKVAYKKVSEWEVLPKGQRALLCLACIFSVGSAQVATVLSTECFKEFGVACEGLDVMETTGCPLRVHNLVCEYSFSSDPSVGRCRALVYRLRASVANVGCPGGAPGRPCADGVYKRCTSMGVAVRCSRR